jgi:fused signal recognition particle receptor
VLKVELCSKCHPFYTGEQKIVDTAGRQHTKSNLMEELRKINRVLGRELPGAPHETLLILDATTGQNALVQAKVFKEATNVTGIVLTKLDGTAKGGIIIGIKDTLGIPVKFIGIGEGMEDLQSFNAREFIRALFV